MPLSYDEAIRVTQSAHERARQIGIRITSVVVDEGGLLQSLEIAVSLGVAAIPEGLTALATSVLALASGRMHRKGTLIRTAFLANFAEDRDIADPQTLGAILAALQLPSQKILERAVSSENKLHLRDQTAQGAALGMFGAPNFVVAGDLFFGQDRMEDAIHWALGH